MAVLEVGTVVTLVKLELLRGTTTIDLSDYINRSIVEFRGLGMATIERLTEKGPYQNGMSDRGFRLQPRNVYLTVNSHGQDYGSMLDLREALMAVLRPGTDPVELRYSAPPSRIRSLYCHVLEGMSGDSLDRLGFRQREVIHLFCPDPTWFDASETVQQLSLAGGGSGWALPWTFPYTMSGSLGSGGIVASLLAGNAWDTYPRISLTGALTNPKITNTLTGDVLDFTGSSIANGDTWTIDTRYGYKSVTDQNGVNKIQFLTAASSLATFRFVPGENSILVSATGVNSNSKAQINYNKRYIGA